jgi:ABC-2 type transport system permease protein
MAVAADSYVLYQRQLAMTVRSRIAVVIGVVQPAAYLVLFGPLIQRTLPVSGQGRAWQIFVPGLLVQLAIFGAGFAGFSLIPDLRAGVLERMRVTQVSRFAMLFGRCLKDATLQLCQSVLLIAIGFALGLRAPVTGLLAGIVTLVIIAVSLASLSYALAMSMPQEYLFAPLLNTIALPLMLLSGILLPLTQAPVWLKDLAHVSPFYYVVNGLRDMFRGDFATGVVAETAGITVVLAIVALVLGTWKFSRENA